MVESSYLMALSRMIVGFLVSVSSAGACETFWLAQRKQVVASTASHGRRHPQPQTTPVPSDRRDPELRLNKPGGCDPVPEQGSLSIFRIKSITKKRNHDFVTEDDREEIRLFQIDPAR